MNRYQLIYNLVAWSSLAFFLIAGWFVIPSSTSFYYEHQGTVHQVDLISFANEGRATEEVHRDASLRAWLLSVFTILGIIVWWMAFLYLCKSTRISCESEPLTNYEMGPLIIFAIPPGLALLVVVSMVVFR